MKVETKPYVPVQRVLRVEGVARRASPAYRLS